MWSASQAAQCMCDRSDAKPIPLESAERKVKSARKRSFSFGETNFAQTQCCTSRPTSRAGLCVVFVACSKDPKL